MHPTKFHYKHNRKNLYRVKKTDIFTTTTTCRIKLETSFNEQRHLLRSAKWRSRTGDGGVWRDEDMVAINSLRTTTTIIIILVNEILRDIFSDKWILLSNPQNLVVHVRSLPHHRSRRLVIFWRACALLIRVQDLSAQRLALGVEAPGSIIMIGGWIIGGCTRRLCNTLHLHGLII